jgi:hydrogenase assembly chaperone HypC/HupF
MCLGFPGRVLAVDASGAVVDLEGRRRRASTLLVPDVAVGDWVYVAAGTIVDRIDPAEAAAIRSTLLAAMARAEALEAVDRRPRPADGGAAEGTDEQEVGSWVERSEGASGRR